MEKVSNYTAELSYQTEVIIKGEPRPVWNYEIIRDGRVIGFLKVKDRKFIEYLYGLGVNIRQA